MCVCVCVRVCAFTYGRGWCGKYREGEEGLSFSDLQILPKCSVRGGLQRCLPAPPQLLLLPAGSSPPQAQTARTVVPRLPQGFGVAWRALVSFRNWGIIADDIHAEQCQNQLYFT